MTAFDDDHIAPVINLFGDRTGAKHTEAGATAVSSEESWAPSPHDPDLSQTDTGEADVGETGDLGDTNEVMRETPPAVAAFAPVRALPRMADFESHSDEERPQAERPQAEQPQPARANPQAEQSQAQRRQARDGFSEISRVSMRAIARRGMSSYEMTQFLGTREFDSAEIETEIERLEGSALLDDAALAETLARTLRDRKGLGASAIKAELRRRKIDNEHIEAVIGGERDDEQERANEIAFKRAPQLRSLDSTTAKRRLSAFLMRKGYSGSIVSAAVAAALAPGASDSSNGPVFR
jgi:SOS response regulatory protein OraA/RecX